MRLILTKMISIQETRLFHALSDLHSFGHLSSMDLVMACRSVSPTQ